VPRGGQQEEPRHERDQFRGVEQAVGYQGEVGRRPVVEMVPSQELVEDDFIDRGHYADADEECRPERLVAQNRTVPDADVVDARVIPASLSPRPYASGPPLA
jgi:hypothetical protein